jgi:hypothetical protein
VKFADFYKEKITQVVNNRIEEENLEINNDDFLKKIELKEVLVDYENETAMKYFLRHFDK